MTRPDQGNRKWAALLIVGGLVLLAAQLGWVGWVSDLLWAVLFLAAGGVLVYHARTAPENWWALIPGAALAGIGAVFLTGQLGGAYFLGVLGLGFLAVYVTGRERWWAVIPAGTLLTLATVTWLDVRVPRFDVSWLFFLGLAATFGALYYLPDPRSRQRWAMFPALACLGLAAVIALSGEVTGIVFPVALILAGAYLLWRRGSTGGRPTAPHGGT